MRQRASNLIDRNAVHVFEVAIMDRRFFLKNTGIGLASFGLMAAAPDFLHQFAGAAGIEEGLRSKEGSRDDLSTRGGRWFEHDRSPRR